MANKFLMNPAGILILIISFIGISAFITFILQNIPFIPDLSFKELFLIVLSTMGVGAVLGKLLAKFG